MLFHINGNTPVKTGPKPTNSLANAPHHKDGILKKSMVKYGYQMKQKGAKKMEHRNSTDSIGELFLIMKNHYDFFNHVMTILLKSKMNNAPITDKDFRLCEEWLGLIADEYLDVSDRFHARLDAKERMD